MTLEQLQKLSTHSTLTLAEALQHAIAHHRLGQLAEAESLYRQILSLDGRNSDCLHLLGLIAHQTGRHDLAVDMIGQAISLNGGVVAFHFNLGNALMASGHPLAAIESYERALALKPDSPEALSSLGNALQMQGNISGAITRYQQALAVKSDFPEGHYNLGNALMAQGDYANAIIHYNQALASRPDFAEALYNVGLALQLQNRLAEAVIPYEQAIAIRPDFAEAIANLATVIKDQGNITEAVLLYRRALSIRPDFAEALSNLATALKDQGKLAEAIACYERALVIKPDFAEALYNLGLALQTECRLTEAIGRYRQALALRPDYAEALSNLGTALKNQCRLAEATTCYRQALAINPHLVHAHSGLIFAMDMMIDVNTCTQQAERKRWAEIHASPFYPVSSRDHANHLDSERPLRIGYVSADFRRHSAATVFGPMLTEFNSSQFEVIAYSNSAIEDSYTLRFQEAVSGWRQITGRSDDAVTELIRHDKIDILVDLSGHTEGNRLLVFARKPAPIQVTAWGYACGTGLRTMDAFLADPVFIPHHERPYYVEDVRYLPSVVGAFFLDPFPDIDGLPALNGKGVTFGSLNRLVKVSDDAIKVWAQVLSAVPGSRILLKTPELADAETREHTLERFVRAGADPKDIILQGTTPWFQHMSAYNQIDFALDPFPHGGGVTTLEGLMMGCPTLTLRWPTQVGRLSASILTTMGLTDWIAETREQYLALAIEKVRDLESLASLRTSLRSSFLTSIIGNSKAYAQAVEAEYRRLWREYVQTNGV